MHSCPAACRRERLLGQNPHGSPNSMLLHLHYKDDTLPTFLLTELLCFSVFFQTLGPDGLSLQEG